MKFTKFTSKGKIEKYVSEISVITFLISRNKIQFYKKTHGGKREYIQSLINNGYTRKVVA